MAWLQRVCVLVAVGTTSGCGWERIPLESGVFMLREIQFLAPEDGDEEDDLDLDGLTVGVDMKKSRIRLRDRDGHLLGDLKLAQGSEAWSQCHHNTDCQEFFLESEIDLGSVVIDNGRVAALHVPGAVIEGETGTGRVVLAFGESHSDSYPDFDDHWNNWPE